ncbi:MAG TPA: SPOR domain-containing protein [Vicinamibacteria bacterium]|nr:SPOR domain-containing protein [Vicinamibacteria bacterium]
MAQDDYYYEIQLTNKQLVFYFMAGASGLILSFLAGIMVGRGVDSAAGEVQASRPAAEERLVEETPQPAAPAAEDLGYARRLEGDRVDDTLERPRPSSPPVSVAAARRSAPTPAPPVKTAKAPPVARPAASATTAASGAASTGSFTIQVGAFKDGASAESVVGRLKEKGFEAYVVAPAAADGLFNVRVGSYRARADAERVQARLRDEEKFKPFIVTR